MSEQFKSNLESILDYLGVVMMSRLRKKLEPC